MEVKQLELSYAVGRYCSVVLECWQDFPKLNVHKCSDFKKFHSLVFVQQKHIHMFKKLLPEKGPDPDLRRGFLGLTQERIWGKFRE